jgi:hypothetical protein
MCSKGEIENTYSKYEWDLMEIGVLKINSPTEPFKGSTITHKEFE